MMMHDQLLTDAETKHAELLEAYDEHNNERARFHKLLGAEATGSEAIGLLRKYVPMLSAAGGGAGILAVLGNVFPSLSAALGLGG